ncbi:MAG TPA: IS110 family transposase, partial [Gemmataceae bacterium]|nr:IS110 family transposase [Gemmataceae bacterium]
MSATRPLDRIGVGIDTARYGHRVSFLRPDHQAAAKPMTVLESRAGYQALQERLEHLHQQHPQAHFHVRIDAAGQYAANLEHFLRGLVLPMTLSIGEPKRNKDYQKAHFPKRTTDDTESQAMARFAVVEQPRASATVSPALTVLREVAGRLQAKVKQSTQAINRLHNVLARVFPELATLTEDVSASWVLALLERYPTAQRIGQARLATLQKIPYLQPELAAQLHLLAQQSVACLSGPVAEALVRDLVEQVRQTQAAEERLRQLLADAFTALPASPHQHLVTIPGIGTATAAAIVAVAVDIERFPSPAHFVGYFGVFPEENSSGVDKQGKPLPPGTLCMSRKGNDLVRHYLWNAARSAITYNPALRALYRRLRAKGKRGDVALGHCMRKLLHLVYAIWKTDRPFDGDHFPWEVRPEWPAPAPAAATEPAPDRTPPAPGPAQNPPATAATPEVGSKATAVGHKRDVPAPVVVTTATATVAPPVPPVKPARSQARPKIDYAFLRQQVTMEQVLRHLGVLDSLRGRGLQRRGPCPIHAQAGERQPTFSAHLGKQVFQCFQADCRAQGNVLDLWAAVQRLPLYEAALHLAATFQL